MVFPVVGCDIYITRGSLGCHVVLAIVDLCNETMAPMLPGCTNYQRVNEKPDAFVLGHLLKIIMG